MSEHTPEFRAPTSKLFSHLKLSIIEPLSIEQYLNEHPNECTLLSEGLGNDSIQSSQLWSESIDEDVQLYASVDFEPFFSTETWDTSIRDAIAHDLRRLLPQLDRVDIPHDTSAVYFLQPGEYHAFVVRTMSDLNSCSIRIDTVPQNNILETAEGTAAIEITEDSRISSQTIVRHATIWAAAHDIAIDAHAEQSSHATVENIIVVHAPFESADYIDNEATPDHHISEMTVDDTDPFDKIGGLFEAKRKLMEYIDIFKDREVASDYALHTPAFILYGPPGTGKTSLMEAFAEASGAAYQMITADEIQDAYIGRTSEKFINLFKAAFNGSQPVVLCFDEIDRYLHKNVHQEFAAAAKTFGTLVEEARKYPHVLIAGATNTPPDQLIGSMVRSRRFEIIAADTPRDDAERIDIWRAIIGKYALNIITDPDTGKEMPLFVPPYSLEDILDGAEITNEILRPEEYGRHTQGMTGADIQEIADIARLDTFRDRRQHGVVRSISHQDILQAIKKYKAVWRPTTDTT